MSKPAIKVEGLYKEYIVGHAHDQHGTFYDLLANSFKAPFRRLRSLGGQVKESERFWALQDVNFEIQPGEVVGIIGRNGAGKSTLLKILSRITAPTRGRIEVHGRLASLLEVGTGFHPELSGRENIFLNGTILGMGRGEISRKFDEIVYFSGIEKFLDTPVKRYSSGMYVRLAFAVSAYVDADVLLVDEVLAVGDLDFQKKCLGKMQEVAGTGRSVLFVSHNLTAIKNLCSRGVLLKGGKVEKVGTIDVVLEEYMNQHSMGSIHKNLDMVRQSGVPGILNRVLVKQQGESARILGSKPSVIVVEVEVLEESLIDVFVHCYDDNQVMVFSSGSFFDNSLSVTQVSKGIYQFYCEIPGWLLNDGRYSLDVMLVKNRGDVFLSEQAVIQFRVEDDFPSIPDWQWRPAGVIRPALKWSRVNCQSNLP